MTTRTLADLRAWSDEALDQTYSGLLQVVAGAIAWHQHARRWEAVDASHRSAVEKARIANHLWTEMERREQERARQEAGL